MARNHIKAKYDKQLSDVQLIWLLSKDVKLKICPIQMEKTIHV